MNTATRVDGIGEAVPSRGRDGAGASPAASLCRAFTMVEVLVGCAIMAVVAAAAVGVLSQVVIFQGEGIAKNQLARDAQLALDVIARDVAAAGVGVPRGMRNDTTPFTGGAPEDHQLRPIVRRAKPDHFVIVGDLPYPNADLNGVVTIAHLKSDNHRTFVTSELSPCTPPSSSPGDYKCDSHLASPLGPFPAADKCAQGSITRTCPWGMNKWQGGSRDIHLIYGGVDGSWYEREWDGADVDTDGPFFGIHITHASPNGNAWGGSDKDLPPDRFFKPRGGGFIAQIDRVFWSLEEPGAPGTACSATTPPFCLLKRRQCWGAVIDPANANFPSVADGAYRSNQTPTECAPPLDGTDWETVIDGVRSVTFRYLDGANSALTGTWDKAAAAQVRAIEVDLLLEAKVKGSTRTVQQRAKKLVYMENRGGLVGNPAVPQANGGCAPALDPGCGGSD